MKKVYICSSLRKEPYAHVTEVLALVKRDLWLLEDTVVLRPTFGDINNRLPHVIQDVGMIREADELWVMGEYGKDCSWEIGFAMALNKTVRVFIDDTNRHLLEQDWMLLYGKSNNTLIYEKLYYV